jgi:hypothetical protein
MTKPPGRPFQKGNKLGRGRPQGSRNKATIALQQTLDGLGEPITKKCAAMALRGDPTALRLCMERLIPPRKDHPAKFTLLPATNATEVAAAQEAVLGDVARGQLTPAEGQIIFDMLAHKLRGIEAVDHEARLQALEEVVSDYNAKEGQSNREFFTFANPTDDHDSCAEKGNDKTDAQH